MFAWVWVKAHFPLESHLVIWYTNHHLIHLQKCQHCGFRTLFNIIWKRIFITNLLFFNEFAILLKTRRNQKRKIPHILLEMWLILFFSSYKNHKLKSKLWWVGACERKKECIFCNIHLVWRNFLLFVFLNIKYSVLNKLY